MPWPGRRARTRAYRAWGAPGLGERGREPPVVFLVNRYRQVPNGLGEIGREQESKPGEAEQGAHAPRSPNHFATLKFTFTSCVIVCFPSYTAVTTIDALFTAPGLASSAALSTSFTSSFPAGMVTASALTPATSFGGTNVTFNSPANSYCRSTFTTTSADCPTLSEPLGTCGGFSFTTALGITVISIGSANTEAGTLFFCLPIGSRTNATGESPRRLTEYLPGRAFGLMSSTTAPSGLSFVSWAVTCTVIGEFCGLGIIGSACRFTFCLSGLVQVAFTGTVTFSPCLTTIAASFSSLPFTLVVALAVSAVSLKNPFSGRTARTSEWSIRETIGTLMPCCGKPQVTVAGRTSRASCLPPTVLVALSVIGPVNAAASPAISR